MSTTRIYLLRHGETRWNIEQRLQGHKDSALTEKGGFQARSNGLQLKKLLADPVRLISSPLGRCRATAAILAKTIEFDPSCIEYEERVKEISFGRWEGRKLSDIKLTESALYQQRRDNRWEVTSPGGENYAMVAQRLRSWLRDIEGQTLVLVSHGCAGRILRGLYLNLSREAIYNLDEPHDAIYLLENDSVTRIN